MSACADTCQHNGTVSLTADPNMITHKCLCLWCLHIALLWIAARFPQQLLCKWPTTQGTLSLGQFYHLCAVSASQALPCPVHSNTIYDLVWTLSKFIPPEQSQQIHKAINTHCVYVAMWRHWIKPWASHRWMATGTELVSPLPLWLLWTSGGLVTSSCLLWRC